MCSGVKIECRGIVPWGGGWEIEGNVLLFDILPSRSRAPSSPRLASPRPARGTGSPLARGPCAGQEGACCGSPTPPAPLPVPPVPPAPCGVLPPALPPHSSLPAHFWLFFFPFGYASQLILSAVSSQMSFLRSGL